MKSWLEKLKVGDKVIISKSYQPERIGIVDRFTKTLIVLKSGSRFNRYTGEELGDTHFRMRLSEGLPHRVVKVELETIKRILGNKLCKVDWESLDVDSLEEINAIVFKARAKAEKNKE